MKRLFRLSDSRPDPTRDVDDEIRFHLEMRTEEFIERGLTPDEARRAAAESFGDVTAIEAECREVRGRRTRERARRDRLRGLALDATFALRTLRKNTGFTLAAILTLGLGIGSAAAVFTVVNGVLIRPLPYAHPSRLAMVWATGRDFRGADDALPLSVANFVDVRAQSHSFESLAAFRSWPYTLQRDAEPEQVLGARVSPALFHTLGVRPLLGRSFTDDEAVVGGPNVAILSYALWQRRFGGSSSLIGQSITLSGQRYTVIGVMPRGFSFPRGAELPAGLQFAPRSEVWTPLAFTEEDLRNRGTLNLAAVGRLRPGVTVAQARSELEAIGKRLAKQYREDETLGLSAVTMKEQAASPVRRGLLILMGAVAFVLLIACANVANLLIARTASRQRELAVRTALGAARSRIARQLITENVVLTLGGAVLGMLLAAWGSRVMLALVPGSLPRADDVTMDWRVLLATLAIALLAGVVFGLATAAHGDRADLSGTLQSGGARTTANATRRFGRRLLVATEIALSLVLLIGAGLLAGSFLQLQDVTPGFVPKHAFTADVLLPIGEHLDVTRDGPQWAAFFDQLMARLNTIPGVQAAGGVSSLPLSGAEESSSFRIEGRPVPPPSQAPRTDYMVVDGKYLAAMGIKLVAGRAFDSRDRADGVRVVIVSKELARRYFPNESPIGKQIHLNFELTRHGTREVVGVVNDVKQTSLDAGATPAIYVPESQMPYPYLTLVIRTQGDPLVALPAVRRELAALDPSLALSGVRTLHDVFADSLARQRFSMIMLGVFAASALLLALVGLYGVIALSVSQRTREIGVRMALGARPRDVMVLVLGEGVRVTVIGLIVGLAGAVALTQVLRSLLYGVSATNALVYGAASALVAAVALLATYLPARRSMRVDPVQALREG